MKYWELDKLKMLSLETETLIKKLNKDEKTIINVNIHSCNSYKYPKLEVNNKYWINLNNKFSSEIQYELCTITYIRSGVIFYVLDSNPTKEYYFEEFCLNHLHCSPKEITVNLDSDYYEVRDFCGKMKVNYIGKL